MQPKKFVKLLIDESLNGNFRNVSSNIIAKGLDGSVDTQCAIKILVAVCNCCHKNLSTPQNVNEEEMGDLIKCVLKFIRNVSDGQYDSYIQSIFYILKLLIEKKSYDCIIQLKEMFVPEFMPLIPTDKHFSIYQSICKSIYNVIVRAAQTKEKTHIQKYLKLGYLLSDLYRKLDKKTTLFESVHNCILAFITLGASSKELLEFYQHVTVDEIQDLSLYPSIVNNLSLLYTHLLRNQENSLAQDCYKFTIERLSLLFKGKEFVLLTDIMTLIEWLNPINLASLTPQVPIRAHTSLKHYYQKYNSTPNLQCVCDLISSIAFTTLQLYKKTDRWSEEKSAHFQFYKFLNDVAVIMSKTVYPCHCRSCSTKTNVNEALRTLNTIGGFGRVCITGKNDTSNTYKMEILRYIEKNVEHVTTLKTNNCEKWKKYWYEAACHLYTIGLHLYQKKDELFKSYFQKFVRSLVELEGFRPKLVEKTYLSSALNAMADSYYESHDYEKCLLVTALSLILSDSPKNELNRWMRAKAAVRDNSIEEKREVQELTLVSICDKYPSELETYLGKNELQLTTKRKIELLVYELRQYNAKWRSKLPMSAVFGELSRIANSQLCAEIFIEIWGDGNMLVHETLPKLLQNTIRRIELEKMSKKDLILAHLYFLQHKYRVKDIMVKHCDEMEKTMNMTKASEGVVNGTVAPDPNDECDLVSSYESLKLSRYIKMMKELNRSLELAHIWVSNNNTEERDREKLFKLLANIGHEFRLHDHTTSALQAWELALKIAESPLHKLQATGFLIELSDARKPLVKKLIQEAEEHIETLSAGKNFEQLMVYFLCKTECYFHVDVEIAKNAFRQALQLHQQCKESNILLARIHLVQHKFNLLPCTFEIEDHHKHSLVRIHQASDVIEECYNGSSNDSSYDLRIFFDIYEALARMYHDLRLPRDVRCYTKVTVVVAQKMLLPLRTTSLLYYLAYADVLTCRSDDCRVKIQDYSDILGLSKYETFVTPTQVKNEKKDDVVEILTEGLNELVLDLPKRERVTSSGSPSLPAEVFKTPFFLKHEGSCECYFCTCLEYHVFVLRNLCLNAVYADLEDNLEIARDFYLGGVKVYEYLLTKEGLYLEKMAKKISADLVPDMRQQLIEIYCVNLLEYGNFLIRNGQYTEAENVNKILLDKLEPYSLRFPYLYDETLLQKLNILDIIHAKEEEEQAEEKEIPNADVEDIDATTPESKRTAVLICPVGNRSASKAPVKIQPKSLKFDLSDDEETSEKQKTTLPKNLPPPLKNLMAKTPAPSTSKIRVYADKSAKKPKSVLSEIPALKVALSECGTPTISSKIDSQLASSTKLLTERLRKSSRKGATDENIRTEAKKTVRQNLMNHLEPDGEKSGAVRRSARSRK